MRDQHWEHCHNEQTSTTQIPENIDEDEVLPLLFDLVRSDKVILFKSLLPQSITLSGKAKDELFNFSMEYGSPAILDLLKSVFYFEIHEHIAGKTYPLIDKGFAAAIRGNNTETFQHLLLIAGRNWYSIILPEILKSKSEEFRLGWETNVDAESEYWSRRLEKMPRRDSKAPFGSRYTRSSLLRVSKADPNNEAFILLVWEKLNLAKSLSQVYLGDALVNVAATCCSEKMAKYLINAGAPVNHRRSSHYLTSLHHAVMHNTPEAAKLVKYLLGKGADPAAFFTSAPKKGSMIRRIRDEAGAKDISKWLGMSWDDLVENTAKEMKEDGKPETSNGNQVP